jgi:peroxiredoxin (alkyl hydroperoxide reductase subunit C)
VPAAPSSRITSRAGRPNTPERLAPAAGTAVCWSGPGIAARPRLGHPPPVGQADVPSTLERHTPEVVPMSDVAAPVSLPRLNEPAPQFEANSTHGPVKLSDYKGSWLVLFSHPADFTPVCTTEFIAFAKNAPAFEQMGVKLLGLSIDSIYSHIAWVKNIEQNFDVQIPFPVIADLDMKVAQKYGMIHPGAATTATVRCVFVIDPNQIVRAMIYYPLSNGRSIDEVKRLVTALQTTDKHGRATPENWQPGEKVIVPPPTTIKDTNERYKAGFEMKDWYFSKTDLK